MAQWWQLHHLPKLHVCCCNVALDSDRAGNINRLGHVSAGVDPDISLPRVDGQESVTYLERLGLRKVLQQELTLVLVGLGRPVVLCGPAAFKAFAPGTCSKALAVQ